jgi:hypothetical protein
MDGLRRVGHEWQLLCGRVGGDEERRDDDWLVMSAIR